MNEPDSPPVAIVLVSHSAKLAEGLAELAGQMAGPDVRLIAVGGAPGGRLGTDPDRIGSAIRAADAGAGVLVMCDLGSAIMATESAIEMLDAELAARVRLSGGPFVEGAVIAAVQASVGDSLDDVLHAADEARDLDKGISR
jgi:phosphoenolpyruvate---glycerone phosphotransferase subunit DhaM